MSAPETEISLPDSNGVMTVSLRQTPEKEETHL